MWAGPFKSDRLFRCAACLLSVPAYNIKTNYILIKQTELTFVLSCCHPFKQIMCVFVSAEWSKSSDFTEVLDSRGKSQNRKTVKIQESSPDTVMWHKCVLQSILLTFTLLMTIELSPRWFSNSVCFIFCDSSPELVPSLNFLWKIGSHAVPLVWCLLEKAPQVERGTYMLVGFNQPQSAQ